MVEIDLAFVESVAPNAAALSNGRGLVAKGKFVALHRSEDQTLLFGECSGSGASNYRCSCDFLDLAKPVYRCSCPSRQFPCKHCVGLLLALVNGNKLTTADVPEDVQSKRAKIETTAEKKKVDATQPRKVNKSALAKKIKAQLDGLDLLERLTQDLVRSGMGNTNAKTAIQIEEQAKQLANAYLPGAQSALHGYTKLFLNHEGRVDGDINSATRERIYSEALDQLTRLNAIVKQGRLYLSERLDNPEKLPETNTSIAAWLGHAWQLRDLKDAGLVRESVELIQLAFNSYDDIARREFVDTGIWMELETGDIQLTQNFRPYKAAKHIKSDDSFFKIAQVPELCVYPGELNRRVRWEAATQRNVELADLAKVRSHSKVDLVSVVKEIKSHLKSPLADKQPIVAIQFASIGIADDGTLALEDRKGERIVLTDRGLTDEPASCHLLGMLPSEMVRNQTLVARFVTDLDSRTLHVKPLSIVTDSQIYRLTF